MVLVLPSWPHLLSLEVLVFSFFGRFSRSFSSFFWGGFSRWHQDTLRAARAALPAAGQERPAPTPARAEESGAWVLLSCLGSIRLFCGTFCWRVFYFVLETTAVF